MIRVLIFILFVVSTAFAQDPVVFVESGDRLRIPERSGALAKAIVDLNGDYRDDLLTVVDDKVVVSIQTNDGSLIKQVYQDDIQGSAYSLNVGDFNNDRFNDFLYSGFYNGIYTYLNNKSLTDFIPGQWIDTDIYAQGCSLYDINNDGWLDALITHDEGTNQVFINDQAGNLILEEIIDFNTIPVSDNSGNYSAIWVDVNGDDRQDLYISKCKNGVDDSSDPRRINALYINEPAGFREAAAEFNVNQGEQTWCADSGDLDNDGDIDIFLINHWEPHVLLENIDNMGYVVRTDYLNGGSLTNFDLEVSIQDFNNDGLNDILISGVKDNLLLNKGGLQFTKNENPFGLKNASSAAVGDINSDGYLDCYISFGGPATPSTISDETWLNFGGNNNYLMLSFAGTDSNKSGIGTKVQLYGAWGIQTKWLNSGTAYGITNSLNMHFGLSQNEIVDSLIIQWPSGHTDRYYDLQANQHFIATENLCIEKILDINYSNSILDCDNETITMSSDNQAILQWTTGDTSDAIIVNKPGFYSAGTTDQQCVNNGPTICIDTLRPLIKPHINFSGDWILCQDDQVDLKLLNNPEGIIWSTGEMNSEININTDGVYFAQSINNCDSITSDSLQLIFIDNASVDSLIMIEGIQTLELDIQGEWIQWYDDALATNKIGEFFPLIFTDLDHDTTVYYTNTIRRTINGMEGGAILDTNMLAFDSDMINGEMEFEVHERAELVSFVVFSREPGIRRVIVKENNDTIFTRNYSMDRNAYLLYLNLPLDPGNYIVTTDSEVNKEELGIEAPGFSAILDKETIDYPYTVSSLASITNSSFGSNKYFYFFDWTMKPYYDECVSEIGTIEIQVDTTVHNFNVQLEQKLIDVHPNPTSNYLTLDNHNTPIEFNLFDVQGREVLFKTKQINNRFQTIDLGHLRSGVYILRAHNGETYQTVRIIKM